MYVTMGNLFFQGGEGGGRGGGGGGAEGGGGGGGGKGGERRGGKEGGRRGGEAGGGGGPGFVRGSREVQRCMTCFFVERFSQMVWVWEPKSFLHIYFSSLASAIYLPGV